MSGVTSRWSSEYVVAEYRDLQANAMAVDCKGQYALLAGRRALALVGLDKPSENVQKVGRQSKWEISAVMWNLHESHHNYFVTACNQRADVCTWGEATCQLQGSLKAHTRVISDLDWSPEEPTQLATCSVDTFTYLWDIRDYRKPTVSLQAVAGASQVQYNRVNSNLLATTHDGDIRVWDPRKGTTPVQYIAGHLSKIHGLDWCRTSEFHLATSSQDGTVKFWDISNARQPESKLPSGSPVWRARYTPFGCGMVTVVVPQLRRGENSLFLWHIEDQNQPIHTFVGHSDVVLEFQWRKEADCADYQLVTWSKDQSLRLWRIDTQLQKLCGHDVGNGIDSPVGGILGPGLTPSILEEEVEDVALTNAANLATTPVNTEMDNKSAELVLAEDAMLAGTPPNRILRRREDIHSPQQPKTLQQEFQLVNFDIPNITVEEMDALTRTFTVKANSGAHLVLLTMTFPENYPNNTKPAFNFGKPTTLDKPTQTKLIKVLCDTALQHVKHNRSCIEPCLRQLTSSLDTLTSTQHSPSGGHQQPPPSYLPIYPSTTGSAFQDVSIPFPRTSGARFCGAGFLVCFTRNSEVSMNSARRTSSHTDLTPRAFTALSSFGTSQVTLTPQSSQPLYNSYYGLAQSPPSEGISRKHFYNYKERKHRSRAKTRPKETSEGRGKDTNLSPKKKAKTGPIVIYNIACLLPISQKLAETYVFEGDSISDVCTKNAAAASAVNRRDLVQVWSLMALTSDKMLEPSMNPDMGTPWPCHPMGRKLIKSLLQHYSAIYDVQTVAMLCCVFGSKCTGQKMTVATPTTTSTRSPSDQNFNNTDPSSLSPMAEPSVAWATVTKMRRSNSCSELYDDYRYMEEARDPVEVEKEQHEKNITLLDNSGQQQQYDQFKKAYAEILYKMQLLTKSSEVLKFVSCPAPTYEGPEFHVICQHCSAKGRSPQCSTCKKYSIRCSLCQTVIKGSASFCIFCGHGGHASHMYDWFVHHSMCPTGCGCECIHDIPAEE